MAYNKATDEIAVRRPISAPRVGIWITGCERGPFLSGSRRPTRRRHTTHCWGTLGTAASPFSWFTGFGVPTVVCR